MGGDLMDYDKLVRRLRNDADAFRDGKTLGRAFADQEDVLDNAAAAIETLRAELAQMAACVYYKAGGLCQCGGDDPANVCVMGPCPHEISVFDLTQLIHHVRLRLEDVKSERDAAVKCIGEIEDALKFQRISAIGLRISEWRCRKEARP